MTWEASVSELWQVALDAMADGVTAGIDTEAVARMARARIVELERELMDAPVHRDCHPGVRWTVESWGERCPLAQRDASIAALVEALRKIDKDIMAMCGFDVGTLVENDFDIRAIRAAIADHAAFAAERDERLRAPLLAAGNALAEAAEHLLYCDLGRCDDCNKARTVIAAWREAAK